MADFGWHYPPGVTQADIDGLYMDEDEEREWDRQVDWLVRDTGWWRRVVKASSRARVRDLVDARYEEVGPPDAGNDSPLDLTDAAWELRRDFHNSASTQARSGVIRSRNERGLPWRRTHFLGWPG
jgi:hypothetical protein